MSQKKSSSSSGSSSNKKVNDDPFAVSAELPGIDNLSAITAINKQEEEVQRYIEQGHLNPSDRAIYILENGSVVQKIAILQKLSSTLEESSDSDISGLVKELNDMWKQDQDVQITASPCIISVLPKFKPKHVSEMQEGINTMIEISNEAIRREWCNVFVECVQYLPNSDLDGITTTALRKCDTSEAQVHRTMGCRVLGKLAQRFEGPKIEKLYLKRAMALCQDTDVQVRVTMCNQLNAIARAIGLALTKQCVTQELLELLVDEEKIVSRAAFTALIDLVDFFDATYRRDQVYPILKHYITSPPEDVLSLLIEEFGRFLYKIRGDVTSSDDVTLFGSFFVSSALKQDPDVRRLCAFNFPAVVASLPSSFYTQHLQHTLKALAQDTHVPTRVSVAAGLHELCGLLTDKTIQSFQETFMLLINDHDAAVLEKVFSHFDVLMAFFHSQLTKEDEKDAFFASLVTPIVNFEVAVRLRWRIFRTLFNHFEHFPKYFKPQQIYDKFLPILFHHIMNGVAAVKPRCAYLIVHFTRSFPVPLIVESYRRVTSDLGRSPSYSHRWEYLNVCSYAIAAYSRKFSRDRLLEVFWDLTKDPVSNVRIKAACVMVDVKKILKPPCDLDIVSNFTQALQRLAADTDPEVRQAMLSVQPQIDELEKKFVKYQGLLAKAVSGSKVNGLPDEDDVADKKKEEFEGNLVEAAKEADKLERRQKLRELLKSEREAETTGPQVPAIGPGRKSNVKPGGPPALVGKPPTTIGAGGSGGVVKTTSGTTVPLPAIAPKGAASKIGHGIKK